MAAQYPTAAGTDANLYVAVNGLATSLNGAINNSVTTITVASTAGFPTAGFITIDAEAISYTGTTGTTFTGCTRAADGTAAASHLTLAPVNQDVVAAHHNVLKDEIKAVETDLVGIMAAITPVTAASTATSALQRVAHIVSQIKNGFGLTNWYDTVTAMMPKSGGAFTGAISFNPSTTGITGTVAVDNAAAGKVGEYVVSAVGLTNYPSTAVYGDLTSISLTAGDWDISAVVNAQANGATVSQIIMGIGTVTGNDSTGVAFGDNGATFNVPTSTSDTAATIPSSRVSISSTTTFYFKYRASYTVAIPQARGRLSARRMR